MHRLSDLWFKEDRAMYKGPELTKEKKATEKAIRNSTIVTRRLRRILNEDLDRCFQEEEDFDDPAWERKTIAAAAKRSYIRRLLKILPSEDKTNV